MINPAMQNEQGGAIAHGPRGTAYLGSPTAVKSPLSLDHADDIIQASGLGAHTRTSSAQFPKMPELPGMPGEGAPAAEGAGAGAEAAGGAAAAEELLPLLAL